MCPHVSGDGLDRLSSSRRSFGRRQAEIRALNEQLIKAQEAERVRIAGELHDSVLQQITSLTLRLGKVRRQVPPDSEATATVNSLQQQLIQIGTDIRQISHELHPALLQESGLPAALSSYCEEFSKVRGLPVSCETEDCGEIVCWGCPVSLPHSSGSARQCRQTFESEESGSSADAESDGRVSLSVSDDGLAARPTTLESLAGWG